MADADATARDGRPCGTGSRVLTAVALFASAVVAILVAGPRMARISDRLAKATGMGGALFGVIFLSVATDLPEVALTPAAVLGGTPRIAVGGLLGGAAGQLVLLAVADMAFRRGKLLAEVHLLSSLGPSAVMLAVLSVPLLVGAGNPRLGPVGLGAVLMVVAYVGTLAAVRGVKEQKREVPGPEDRDELAGEEPVRTGPLWLRFAGFAAVLAAAGVALEASTETIGEAVGFTETAAGALLAGLATSLPELVTAVAAARAGALSLVVGDLIGSSALDVALLALADVFYTEGSIFDLLGGQELTLLGVCLALSCLLVVGLARRKPVERPVVTMESWAMLAVYALGVVVLLTGSASGA
jgi:cation:H+ antiporter